MQTQKVMERRIGPKGAMGGRGISAHFVFVNTTATESESHRSRFGAMTSARFADVIFVTACIGSGRNICRKLITNTRTRRFIVGSFFTISTTFSGSSAHVTQSLYISVGISGSASSRSQSLRSDAGTWQSSMPIQRVY